MVKRCMNRSEGFVDDSLNGIYRAHKGYYESAGGDVRALVHRGAQTRRVGIVTGGGFGHLPVFLGYVGDGLCDGCAVGNVFTSPSCDTILAASRAVAREDGVLFLFGNYFGDSMNFEMAGELLADEGIHTSIVKVSDDLASAPRDAWQERRGIAGISLIYKIAGAYADRGASREELALLLNGAIERLSTFGVAFSSCTLPDADHPIFEILDTDMEIGMGIHGEPGISRAKMVSSNELAAILSQKLVQDQQLASGDRLAVLVNGLGATSREELYILYGDIEDKLQATGAKIVKAYVGEYATSLEMAGLSVSVLKLDQTLESLLDQPAITPFAAF